MAFASPLTADVLALSARQKLPIIKFVKPPCLPNGVFD
jgi:hypothetical protein